MGVFLGTMMRRAVSLLVNLTFTPPSALSSTLSMLFAISSPTPGSMDLPQSGPAATARRCPRNAAELSSPAPSNLVRHNRRAARLGTATRARRIAAPRGLVAADGPEDASSRVAGEEGHRSESRKPRELLRRTRFNPPPQPRRVGQTKTRERVCHQCRPWWPSWPPLKPCPWPPLKPCPWPPLKPCPWPKLKPNPSDSPRGA